MRRAVEEAYRELPQVNFWSYYRRWVVINTVASQDDGTIAYCVTPDHEILTKDGWKKYYDLSVGDLVMAYNHDAGEMRWEPLQAIHTFRYQGPMLSAAMRGREVLCCTPDHRIPIFRERTRKHLRSREWTTARDLLKNDTVPCIAPCNHQGNPGCGLGERLASLLGWMVTDGSGLLDYHDKKKVNQHCTRISQSPTHNSAYCDEIEALTGTTGKVYGSSTCKSIGVKASDRRAIRQIIQRRNDLPPLAAKMSFAEALAFKTACEKADGTKTASGEIVFEQWNRKNGPVAEAYQIACVLVGKGANKRESIYRGKLHHKVTTRKTTETVLGGISRWRAYDGTVWCPQVQSGAWLTRLNGHVMITGNSHSSRTVTLTGSTFPSAARQYRIIIANVHYDIESYTDSTHVVLPESSNPGADVASSTEYTLYKSEYLLPETFRRCLGLWDVSARRPIAIIDDQEEQQVRFGGYSNPGTPYAAAIRNTGEHVNRLSVVFSPPPSSAASFEMLCEMMPRQFVLPEKYSTGTVSISSGAATVTGTGTTFPANCTGCILRVSTSTTQEPTGPYGADINKEDVDNKYTFQSEVITRGSTTSLTLKDNADQAYSSVLYSLSDPLDIEDGAMFTALLHLAAAKYAQMQGDKSFEQRMALANQSLIYAKEFDRRKAQTRPIDWNTARLNTPVTTEGV